MNRVLVLGATGHIGQAVVRHWLGLGCKVTAATRQAEPDSLRGLEVAVARVGDRMEGLENAAAGQDFIVDAAAPHPLDPAVRFQAVAAAVRRTERVLEAVRARKTRLVFVSSFTTLPRVESPLAAMEAAWRRTVYPYFEAKAAMERLVLEAAGAGLPAVVVNPAACLGPWEFRAGESSFVRMALTGRLGAVMDQTLNVIDTRDVAALMERAVAAEMYGRPIALAGHNVSVAELVRLIIGVPPVCVDSRVAAAAAWWTEAVFATTGQRVPDLWRAVPLIADSFPMTPSPEQSGLGVRLRPLAETIRDAVAFHRESLE